MKGRVVAIVVGLAALTIVAVVGIVIFKAVDDIVSGPDGDCTAVVADHEVEISGEQAENASLIAAIAIERGLPARAVSIALATAFQESKLINIDYGDRDSLGLFQQRPSQGWGTEEEILDPVYATNAFYDALVKIDGYENMEITEAAQQVQRSAFPSAYADHEEDARALASALTGYSPATFSCDLDGGAPSGRRGPRRLRADRPRGRRTRGPADAVRRPRPRRFRPGRGVDGSHGGLGALRGPGDRHLLPARERDQPDERLGGGALPRRQRGPARHPHRHLRRPDLDRRPRRGGATTTRPRARARR